MLSLAEKIPRAKTALLRGDGGGPRRLQRGEPARSPGRRRRRSERQGPADPNGDNDRDGYTASEGDCNDASSLIGPAAIEIAGNGIDDDCDGVIDEPLADCDEKLSGRVDAMSLAASLGQCDPKFLTGASFQGPSDMRARAVVSEFGIIKPKAGSSMVLLSTGRAVDKLSPGYVSPQSGTDLGFGNHARQPRALPGRGPGLRHGPASDGERLHRVGREAKRADERLSFSFNFQFFSAEYPEFVCTSYNDEFLVELEAPNEIAARDQHLVRRRQEPDHRQQRLLHRVHELEQAADQALHARVTEITGTGYEDASGAEPIGGSTGWLTTTAPVTPGEEITCTSRSSTKAITSTTRRC